MMRKQTLLYLLLGCSALVFTNFYILHQSSKFLVRDSRSTSQEICLQQLKAAFKACENDDFHLHLCEQMVAPGMALQASRNKSTSNTTYISQQANNKTSNKTFLTIGIASVLRKKNDYIFETLDSILNESTEEERENVTVVVLIADEEYAVRKKRVAALLLEYAKYQSTGFLHVIEIDPEIYPQMTGLRRTYKDSEERVRWRSKQVVDFAFLFNYSIPLSEYFLVLEDDVICAPKYLTGIAEFVRTRKFYWVSLTFTQFLIIGRLFRNKDLKRLVPFLMLFYSEKPVDFLIVQFVDLLVPDADAHTQRVPSLFQHAGIVSSLDGKSQRLKDKLFSMHKRKYDVINPPAELFTTMKTYNFYHPELAYGSAYGFFWTKHVALGDTFDIIFNTTVNVKRIYVRTGSADKESDILGDGVLEVSSRFISMTNNHQVKCAQFVQIAFFRNGIADMELNQVLAEANIQCVRIRALKGQVQWLVISEIAIFT